MNLELEGKIILAANAEPRKHFYDENGNIQSEMIYGGLTTALENYMIEHDGVWIGTGRGEADFDPKVVGDNNTLYVPNKDAEHKYTLKRLNFRQNGEYSQDYIDYYYGYSNGVLWPLFHSMTKYADLENQDKFWQGYKKVNMAFKDAIIGDSEQEKIYNENDIIWTNDYQLLLVPDLVRKERPDANIITFFHIPVPEYDVFKQLDHKEDLWNGICGADLFGVQTPEDAENVLSIAEELGLEVNRNDKTFKSEGHGRVKVGAYPIGIRYEHFRDMKTERYEEEIKEEWGEDLGDFVFYGVDRIDYTKGLLEKIDSLEKLFEKHEDYLGKVSLVQRVPPSSRKKHLEVYKEVEHELKNKVEKLNHKYGDETWKPVKLLEEGVPQEKLVGEYRNADAVWVNSIEDGMNLVIKEALACQEKPKPPVLSKYAGAAVELKKNPFIVDPEDIEGTAETLKQACEAGSKKLKEIWSELLRPVEENDLESWAGKFLRDGKEAQRDL